MVDLYHKIYDGEVFQQSQCIAQENTLMDFFRNMLSALGYESVLQNHKVWRKNNRTAVICLVDDVSTCSQDYSRTLPYLFDANTVVITDNKITVPTQYIVRQLPTSFFGIYHYRPATSQWQPNRRLNFSVNRLDTKRLLLMLEIWHRCRLNSELSSLDYINFNCWSWSGDNSTTQGLQSNFVREWQSLDAIYHSVYQQSFDELAPRMPLLNHDLTHEQSHVSSWLNVVAETYSSDSNIALSEKIFRAMCLPVPWIVYSGKHTVAYLRSLGFDVLPDLVTHCYDSVIENKTAAYGDKMVDFVFDGTDAVTRMRGQDFEQLRLRTAQAASHNQNVLATMRSRWPADFAAWLPTVIQVL